MRQTRCSRGGSWTTLRSCTERYPYASRCGQLSGAPVDCARHRASGTHPLFLCWCRVGLVRRQMLAFSATYTNPLLSQLRQLTNAAQEVMLCPQTAKLEGVCTRAAHMCAAWCGVAPQQSARQNFRRCEAAVRESPFRHASSVHCHNCTFCSPSLCDNGVRRQRQRASWRKRGVAAPPFGPTRVHAGGASCAGLHKCRGWMTFIVAARLHRRLCSATCAAGQRRWLTA